MTDGIKRDPEAKIHEDQWQDRDGFTTIPRFKVDVPVRGDVPVRVLPWPTAADGDGKTEPPTMDEVWRGRRMMWNRWRRGEMVTLTGAPPEWDDSRGWVVAARSTGGEIWHSSWLRLTPITPTTRLTVETTDPDEVRRRLGEVGRIVEGDE